MKLILKKIAFFIFCLTVLGCNSKYYKQNPETEHLLKDNSKILENVLLVNNTDTVVYYRYNTSASGASSLFYNNDFIHSFAFQKLGSGSNILLRIGNGEILKIRYKKEKKEAEEKIPIYKSQKFEVTINGLIISD